MCHMSCVIRLVSHVLCQISCVKCQYFYFSLKNCLDKVEGLLSTGPNPSSLLCMWTLTILYMTFIKRRDTQDGYKAIPFDVQPYRTWSSSNPFICWTIAVIYMTSQVIYRTNPVLITKHPVIFWRNQIRKTRKPIIFRTKSVIFEANPDIEDKFSQN